MRYFNYNTITVTYPESVIWLGDSNCVVIESHNTSDAVGGRIVIRHPNGSETRNILHISEMNRLLFVLDDALMALDTDNIGQYTVQLDIYLNGDLATTCTFTFQLLHGKSFTNRSHGISRTVYLYHPDEANKVQFYSPSDGLLEVSNTQYPLNEGLNSYNLGWLLHNVGTYTVCLISASTAPSAVISGDMPITPTSHELYYSTNGGGEPTDEVKGGDIWRGEEDIFPICHTVIMDTTCNGSDFVELMYTDCDGCTRYIGGKLVKEVNKAAGDSYTRTGGEVYKNIPRRHLTSNSRTITAGFYDMATDAYVQDIRYSDRVWMRNYKDEWVPVVIASDSITTKNGDTQDIELDIIISEEL